MGKHIAPPSAIRWMNHVEYDIVTAVFRSTIPYRWRILISNAAGKDGRPFTIPTSLISTILGIAPDLFLAPAVMAGLAGGYLASIVNLGYIINAGDEYATLSGAGARTLVHETAHVWQGKNSRFALTYVFNSLINQGLHGSGAYAYRPLKPGHDYNAEAQAKLVEDWWASGSPASGDLYPYITDYVRKGDA